MSNLTETKFEPQTSHSNDERITTRPTKEQCYSYMFLKFNVVCLGLVCASKFQVFSQCFGQIICKRDLKAGSGPVYVYLCIVFAQTYNFNHITGVEINFFNNLPVGQVIANVYLPGKISTCSKQRDTVHFDVA